jgi:tellurite methyltransferase
VLSRWHGLNEPPMSLVGRESWDQRHRAEDETGAPEPFVIEMLPLMRAGGLALDVAAGRGRHSIALAQKGMRVVAVDYSKVAATALKASALEGRLKIEPVVVDLEAPPIPFHDGSFDTILNVNFLDRGLIDHLKIALRTGGVLLFETFLARQAKIGHPKDPKFLLGEGELLKLMLGLEVTAYRQGLIVYPNGKQAWRAGAVGIKR